MRVLTVRFGILVSLILLSSLSFAHWEGLDEGFSVQFSSTDSIRLAWNSTDVDTPFVRYMQTETPTVNHQYAACYIAVPRGKYPSLIGHTGFNDTTITLATPVNMRELWMAPVNLKLMNPNHAAGNVTSGTITIGFRDSTVAPPALTRGVSTVFLPLYHSLVPNFETVTPTASTLLPPCVVVILGDTAFNAPITNWVNWRGSLGWKVVVADINTLNAITVTAIKTYILSAYNNWAIPPDAIYLIGNHNLIPDQYVYTEDPGTMWSSGSGGQPYPGNYLDENYYTRLDGLTWHNLPDPMPDMLIGRMSVGNVQQCNAQIVKTINYESVSDSLAWRNNALIAADQESTTMVETKRWTRARMIESGLIATDSLFTSSSGQLLNGMLQQGRCLVNYRGQGWSTWWYGINYTYADVANLNNVNKPVIVTGIGCGVAKFDDANCFGEAWMQLGSNLGAAGFMGPTWNTHTQYNNQVDIGLYRFWFHQKYYGFMLGLMAGKAQLLSSMATYSSTDQSIQEILRVGCSQYIALSDPTMNIMAGVPSQLNVEAPTNIGFGQQAVNFNVTNTSNGTPHANVMVGLYDSNGPLGAAWTDSTGNATVTANLGFTPRYIHYGISGYRARVKKDSISVIDLTTIRFDSLTVMNPGGVISPGDTLRMNLTVTNISGQSESNITIQLDSVSSYLTPVSTVRNLTFTPNQTQVLTGLTAVLSASYRSALPIRVHFGGTSDTIPLAGYGYNINVAYPVVSVDSVSFDPAGNGWLDRGETAPLVLDIHNTSAIDLSQLSVQLLVNDPFVHFPVTQQNVPVPPDSSVNVLSGFNATANDSLPTFHACNISVVLHKTFPTYSFDDTTNFILETGTIDSTAPSHVPNSPYYAYESDDHDYSEMPSSAFTDISPNGQGGGFRIPFTSGNDAMAVMLTPLTFRYFGTVYSMVTVCTDGWLAPTRADTVGNNPVNDTLPNTHSPVGVIAPYWDNLFFPGDNTQNVYWSRDTQHHRFILQWDSVCYSNNHNIRMDFQAIIYDAAYDSTPTGDSKIEFVYRNDPGVGTPTIGIEAPGNTTGMTLLYNGNYAATMHTTHTYPWAIRITTRVPVYHNSAVHDALNRDLIPKVFAIQGPYPNPFNPETRISVAIPKTMPLKIDLFNVSGQLVRKIVSTNAAPGHYNFTIRGDNLSSGEYFILVTAGSIHTVRKMMLIK